MLRLLNREARRDMTARCTVTRGEHPDVETIHVDLPCTPRPTKAIQSVRDVESGAKTVGLLQHDIRVPRDADIRRGDVVRIDESRDPNYVGRHLIVRFVPADEWLSVRTIQCQESS
jgi:hypothetical protein